MKIDLTKLITNRVPYISINENITIPNEYIEGSLIKELHNVSINAKIKIDEENELIMTGNIKGSMTLQDDITLEPVEYEFDSELDEILDKDKTELNLIDVSWQNILVEIPSKVRSTNEDIELSGNGWRVISEEKYQEERNTANNPFANLKNLINAKEEK